MSDNPLTPPNRDEDALFAFGDHLAGGDNPIPSTALEATAARVQRALRDDEARTKAMPAARRAAIWEDVMQATTSGTVPVSGRSSNPTRLKPAASSRATTGAAARVSAYPRMMWTGAANIALVVLVVLAGFAAWKTFGGLGWSDGDSDPTVPGVAMQPATPDTIEAPAVAPSPAATPAPISACNLDGGLPIIPDLGSDDPPLITTSLYLVRHDATGTDPRGELKLGCEGENSVLLAENVISAWQGPWAGTVAVAILPPGEDDLTRQLNAYVNVASGQMVAFGKSDDDTKEQSVMTYSVDGSPWVIGPLADAPDELALVDLRTMDSRPLAQVLGTTIGSGTSLMLSTAADDGTIALGLAEGNYGGTLKTAADAPGNLLLLGSSFDDTRWIAVPDTLEGVSAIIVSPDGRYAAVVTQGEGDPAGETYRYGVISLADGAVVGRSDEIPRFDNPFVTWIREGAAVAYLAGNELQIIAVDGGGEPETAFLADQQLMHLQSTWDPNVVVASTRRDHGSDADPGSTGVDMVYAVNVATRDVHEFTGMDASGSIGWITDAGALVMYQWDDAYPDTTTYQVFDPVTGSQIGEIADAPSVQPKERTMPTIGPNSIAISADGRLEVIGLGTPNVYAFTAGQDGMTMERIQPPEGLLAEVFLTANVFLSSNGTLLSLAGEEDEGRNRYIIALDNPDATWLEIPNTVPGPRGQGMITFAEGPGT